MKGIIRTGFCRIILLLSQVPQSSPPAESPRIEPAMRFATVSYSYKNTADKDIAGLRQAAENGDPLAQNNLGYAYAIGQGVAPDTESALKWLNRAIASGFVAAQFNLGVLYEYGFGVPKDYAKALANFQIAANQGFTPAENKLGLFYEKGWAVPADLKQGFGGFESPQSVATPRRSASLEIDTTKATASPTTMQKPQSGTGKPPIRAMHRPKTTWARCTARAWAFAQDYSAAITWYRRAFAHGLDEAETTSASCMKTAPASTKITGRPQPGINPPRRMARPRTVQSRHPLLHRPRRSSRLRQRLGPRTAAPPPPETVSPLAAH